MNIQPSGTDWEHAPGVADWENQALSTIQQLITEDFGTESAPEQIIRLTYMGAGTFEGPPLSDLPNPDREDEQMQVTCWRLRYPDLESVEISTQPGEDAGETVTVSGDKAELFRGTMYVRPGAPASVMLACGAMWCRGVQIGKAKMDAETREELRREFHELLDYASENMPQIRGTPEENEDLEIDVRADILERLEGVRDELKGDTYHVDLPPFTVEVEDDEDDAPAPRKETPEWKRSPFQANDGKAAGMPSGPFVLSSTRALATAKGRPAPEEEGNWTRGKGGHPVYVKSFGGNPYEGEVTFTVRAREDATAADMDASLRWALLDEIGPRVQWAHMYLLAHAADPARRGSREWMPPINPVNFEHALGLRRSKKSTARQRYQEVQSVVDALTSIYVKTENLKVQGRKVRIQTPSAVETPLWNLELPTVAEVDMFDGSADVNWYLRAMEGAWADEFLHGREGMPLTWLPKDYFSRRDGRRKFVRRLVPYLIPLFKAAQRQGYRAHLSAEEMLKICGVDLTQKRSSSQRSRLKNQILTALSQLEDVYGIKVHDPNGVRQKYIPWGDWKGRTAYFDPPEEIDGLLLRQEEPKPKLPEVPAENWTSSQISRLRKEILGGPPQWTQERLADKLGCTKQYVSQLERGKKNNPSREIRETLTRLYHRHK